MMTPKEQQVWYSKALELLGPYRYHLFELLSSPVESRTKDFVTLVVSKEKIKASLQQMDKVETFFTHQHTGDASSLMERLVNK